MEGGGMDGMEEGMDGMEWKEMDGHPEPWIPRVM